MGDWSSSTLAQVVTLQRGHDLPSTLRGAGSVPVIGSFGITGFHDHAKYTGPGVAIGRSGASIGVATFCPDDYWPLNTCLFVKDFKANDPRWLYYLLDSIDFSSYNSGSAQPSLNRNYLANIEVALPPKEEQCGIAATLGALDDKIESTRRARRTADDLGDALWTLLANRTADRMSLDRLISSGGIRLSDGYRTRSDELGAPGLPILRVADMVDEHYALAPEGERIHDTFRAKYSEKVALPGDACVTTKGTIGRTALVRPDDPQAVYSPQLCFLRATARSPLPPSALYRWLRSPAFTSQALTVQHQTDMAAYVSLVDFRQFTIPLVDPLADELREIEALDDVAASKRREVAALTRLRNALLPELLSGRIRVTEATSVVQDVIDESESA